VDTAPFEERRATGVRLVGGEEIDVDQAEQTQRDRATGIGDTRVAAVAGTGRLTCTSSPRT
jgi:hypothetical protein